MKLQFAASLLCFCAFVAHAAGTPATKSPPAKPAAKTQAPAGKTVPRHFFVSGSAGGIAEIDLPAGWDISGRTSPIAMRMQAPGAPDKLQLTAFPISKDKIALASDDKLRDMLSENGKSMLKFSAETGFDILPLPGARGFYFGLSDKALAGKPGGPDKFPFVHSGALRFGEWVGIFNVFSNEKQGRFVQESLAAAASLRWSAPVPAAQGERAIAAMRFAAVPEGMTRKSEINCVSPQAKMLYDRFNDLYGPMLGTHTVKSSFESYDAGGGDAGSVLYMSFNLPVQNDLRAFVAGLLWHEAFPTREHPEEFFAAGSELVVWCTPVESRIKRLSQTRLEEALFPPAKSERR